MSSKHSNSAFCAQSVLCPVVSPETGPLLASDMRQDNVEGMACGLELSGSQSLNPVEPFLHSLLSLSSQEENA